MNTITEVKKVPETMLNDVLKGLKRSQKTLPSKYFYDERGSELFEQLCDLDEYYLTRTELQIMQENIHEITHQLGEHIQLVELGSGSSYKTRLLLDHLPRIESYIPVDISETFLDGVAKQLQAEYPDLTIKPIAADYTHSMQLPPLPEGVQRLIYFPGSTIGNFTREKAEDFISLIAGTLNEMGGLLIGYDLVKERRTLLEAYNDSNGLTAEFNKNILRHINRELGADFDLMKFNHEAIFNEVKSRIEMHLVSLSDQTVRIKGEKIHFEKGETIHTENSHKYSLTSFRKMTRSYFSGTNTWTDPDEFFAVEYLYDS